MMAVLVFRSLIGSCRRRFVFPFLLLFFFFFFCCSVVLPVFCGANDEPARPASGSGGGVGVGGVGVKGDHQLKVRKCEPIRVDICRGLGYNVTGLPNLVGHESQPDADLQLRTFTPLIQYGCSSELRFFLCAVYAPMCTEKVVDVIGPCRSVCERVRQSCEPVLRQFGFPWPVGLNCSKFHLFNGNQYMCMDGSTGPTGGTREGGPPPPPPQPPSPAAAAPEVYRDPRWRSHGHLINYPAPTPTPASAFGGAAGGSSTGGSCRNPEVFVYSNRTGRCLLRCDRDSDFGKDDERIADAWMGVWSSVALVATSFVAATFVVDVERFSSSPERHVVFMSSCYGMTSVAYLVRVVAGLRAISCVPLDSPPTAKDLTSSPMVLAENGLASTDCTVLFVIVYYFTMAGIAWWLVLTVDWLLAAGMGWTRDEVSRLGTYFHIFSWTVPAVKVIIVLVRKNIEPDEFTGMCHVTSTDSTAVVGFLLAPMSAYLFLGTTFLIGGLVGFYQDMARRRGHETTSTARAASLRDKGRPTNDRRKTTSGGGGTVRLATFSALCALPLVGMTACVLYGYVNIGRTDSRFASVENVVDPEEDDGSSGRPIHSPRSVTVSLVQMLVSLLVGIFAGIWTLLNRNTKRSWIRFIRQRRCCSGNDKESQSHRHPPSLRTSSASRTIVSDVRPDRKNVPGDRRRQERRKFRISRIPNSCESDVRMAGLESTKKVSEV